MNSSPDTSHLPIGFIGLGLMGQPMARRMLQAGHDLVVWNRSAEKVSPLEPAGARAAADPAEVFSRARIVVLMLADGAAIDTVLDRESDQFGARVTGCTIIQMGTMSPAYSKRLEADIRAAGGRYVEAPVSGSRPPAEKGMLVAMLAGEPRVVEDVRPLLAPMCQQTIVCGPVPHALLMKLSINVFLITMVTGLTEAVRFAARSGLDLEQFAAILDAGPMASEVSRAKAAKLVGDDFAAQAAAHDVLKNTRLIAETARRGDFASPLVDVCHSLYEQTVALGLGSADMVAVIRGIEATTRSGPPQGNFDSAHR